MMKECLLNFQHMFIIFDLLTFQITHIEDIRNLVSLSGDLGDSYIETEIEQSMGNQIEKAHMIVCKDLNQTKEIGRFVVHNDSRWARWLLFHSDGNRGKVFLSRFF